MTSDVWDTGQEDSPTEEDAGSVPDLPNAADSVAVAKASKAAKRRRDAAGKFWATVLDDPVGRAEVWGLLTTAGAFETRFACGPNGFPQTEATWFHAGSQAFGLDLFMRLQALDPAGVLKMQIEHDPRFTALKRAGQPKSEAR